MRTLTPIFGLLAAAVLTACSRGAPQGVALASLSGVQGAGAGPSTRAAPAYSPSPNNAVGSDSSTNDNGPNAGGQHH